MLLDHGIVGTVCGAANVDRRDIVVFVIGYCVMIGTDVVSCFFLNLAASHGDQ